MNEVKACNCIGPQNGEPRCPCMMNSVTIKDGRYIQVIDLGPVDPDKPFTLSYEWQGILAGLNSTTSGT